MPVLLLARVGETVTDPSYGPSYGKNTAADVADVCMPDNQALCVARRNNSVELEQRPQCLSQGFLTADSGGGRPCVQRSHVDKLTIALVPSLPSEHCCSR
jgi:hypothetical protein